jgi:hypothetical protein
MTKCTTLDCGRITSLYLCTACVIELDDLLADVPALVVYLDGPILNGSVTRPPGAGGGGGVAGSKPPVSLDGMLLQAWLRQLPARAHAEAMENPDAGQVMYMARLWVKQARDLVWGPEELRVYGQCEAPLPCQGEEPLPGHESDPCPGKLTARPDDVSVKCQECGAVHHVSDLLGKISEKVKGQPMAPRAVREYLQAKARVIVSKFDFENWVKHGKLAHVLDRVTTTARPPKLYYPGDVLTVYEDMQAKRRIPR